MMKVLWPKDCEDIRKALIEYAEVIKARDRKVELNCHRFDGCLEAWKAYQYECKDLAPTLANVLYWLFSPISKRGEA